MVSHPGTPGGDRRIRPLNLPKPVGVDIDSEGRPLYVTLPDRNPQMVIDLVKSWRVDEEWWREQPISRIYWQCVLDNGQFLTIFNDLSDGTWWRQRA
ncbi:MAG: hypothetical protein R3A46_08885 [Thermomicrobiales bacterium]